MMKPGRAVQARSRTQRFDDHLNGVEEELALMAQEIHTLRKENEELSALGMHFVTSLLQNSFYTDFAVGWQAKELLRIRQEKVCLLCRHEILGGEPLNQATTSSKPRRRSTIASSTLPLRGRPSITADDSRGGPGLHSSSSQIYSRSDVLASVATPKFKKSSLQPQVKLGRSALPTPPSATSTSPTVLSNLASIKKSPRSAHTLGPMRSQTTSSEYSSSEAANGIAHSSPISSIPSTATIPEAEHGQPWSVEFSNEAERSLNVEMALSLNQEKPL